MSMKDTYMQIFFIISSVGFVILWILCGIILVYIIRALRTFDRISQKLEKNIQALGDDARDIVEDVRDSAVFSFLFKKKRRGERKDKR